MRGRPIRARRLVLYLGPAGRPPGAAFVASGRVGNAVRRNRAKRVMREAWRAVAPRLREPADAVLVARAAIAGARTNELIEEVEDVLARAGILR